MGSFEHELSVAEQLAREAAAILLEHHGQELAVDSKGIDGPVTRADRESSALIEHGLSRAFAGDLVVSEEAAVDFDRLARGGRVWFVDPLDGTREYLQGSDRFSVLIGLAIDARPVLGVVYQPIGERLYRAAPGVTPCCLEPGSARALQVADRAAIDALRLVVSQTDRRPILDGMKAALGIEREHGMGSVGLKLSVIAAGDFDLYINPTSGPKAWDTCAGTAILNAAGGVVTDLHGEALHYDGRGGDLRHDRGIVASGGRWHGGVIAGIARFYARHSAGS